MIKVESVRQKTEKNEEQKKVLFTLMALHANLQIAPIRKHHFAFYMSSYALTEFIVELLSSV